VIHNGGGGGRIWNQGEEAGSARRGKTQENQDGARLWDVFQGKRRKKDRLAPRGRQGESVVEKERRGP
ncbi:hypothetical protein LH496_27785, partial [Klebsiella pneumoniae]|uniref:hypothetical protein n=1 Tax=Klebsiella pneumoniae TaxID=573 RepID=UPI001E444AF8